MPAAGLKEMAHARTAKVGHFIVEFVSPGIGYLLKNAGCDFVLFDTEHSGFHNETIKSALRYFEAAQLPVIVRVPSKEYHHIARAIQCLQIFVRKIVHQHDNVRVMRIPSAALVQHLVHAIMWIRKRLDDQ